MITSAIFKKLTCRLKVNVQKRYLKIMVINKIRARVAILIRQQINKKRVYDDKTVNTLGRYNYICIYTQCGYIKIYKHGQKGEIERSIIIGEFTIPLIISIRKWDFEQHWITNGCIIYIISIFIIYTYQNILSKNSITWFSQVHTEFFQKKTHIRWQSKSPQIKENKNCDKHLF